MLSGEWGTVRGMGAIQVGEVGAVQGGAVQEGAVWGVGVVQGLGAVQGGWYCPVVLSITGSDIITPPPLGQTDRSKNLPCPKLRLRAVII